MREPKVVYGIKCTDDRGDYMHGSMYRKREDAEEDAERLLYAGIVNSCKIVSFFLV